MTVEELLNAIRRHRAAKTPKEWTPADKQLYSILPELKEAKE